MRDLISVIIPVYKVEKYLCRCVDSVLEQTYTNMEIILVDDGSPDNCPVMCDEYARQDSRVKVIHQENAGLSGARKRALTWRRVSGWLLWIRTIIWRRFSGATVSGLCEYGQQLKCLPLGICAR